MADGSPIANKWGYGVGGVWLGWKLEGVGVLLLISQVSKPYTLVLTKEQCMWGKLWGKINKGPVEPLFT